MTGVVGTVGGMVTRPEYIDIVRTLYSLGAASAQDDREGFVILAESAVDDLERFVIAAVVAMRVPVLAIAQRDQLPLRTLLADTGPLAAVPGTLRDAVRRLHHEEDFEATTVLADLTDMVRNGQEPVADEPILVLGSVVDAMVSTWNLQVGDEHVVEHARRLLLATGMLPE